MARLPVYHNQSSGVAISRINPQIDTSVSKAVGNVGSALGNLALAWKQTQDKQREQNLALERAEFQAKMKMEEDFVKRKEKEAEQREKEEEKKAREEERKLQQEELRQYREDMRRYREEAKLERQAEKAEREAEKREKEKQKALEEWKKTVNETENLSGKLAMQDRYRDITTKAKGISAADFAELKNEEKNLLNEADKVIPSVTESFTNKDNADMFALKNGAEASTAKAMIEEIFRSKYKDIASADLLKSESGNHDDYVRTGDAVFKENYFADIDSARRANWLSEKEAAEMKAATNKWDEDYARNIAYTSPEAALEYLSSFDLSAEDRQKVKETAENVLKKREDIRKEGKSEEISEQQAMTQEINYNMYQDIWKEDDNAVAKNMDSLFEYRQAIEAKYRAGELSKKDYVKLATPTVQPLLKMIKKHNAGTPMFWNTSFDEAVLGVTKRVSLEKDNDEAKAYVYDAVYWGLKEKGVDMNKRIGRNDKDIEEVVEQVSKEYLHNKDAGLLGVEANKVLLGTKMFDYDKPKDGGKEHKATKYQIMQDKYGKQYKVFADKDGKFTKQSVMLRIK